MTAKVDAASAVEPGGVEMSGKTNSSASSTGTRKVSMFAAKSGFVIPKNKLSGSLVPIFRGSKNLGAGNAVGGESKKQIQRKTKWGPDLTQDASVKKGRASAYQTRVDQITQKLESGTLEAENDGGLPSAPQVTHQKSSRHQTDSEDVEQLQLEKREAIGEILKLNPSYKAPSDYKPLLKEAKVPIPVKEYPSYNFIGLIYGPGSDNKKQLEQETGAKIQVYGMKAGTGEKAEIIPSDGSEIQGDYEKLYIHISADTFEKVDAAVAVIELLVTTVSGNLSAVGKASASVSGDNAHVPSQGLDTTTPSRVSTTVVNQGMVQPGAPNAQFQYPGPFFSTDPSSTPMNIHGFTPVNSVRPILSNHSYLSTSPFNSSNMPSLFGPPPGLVSPQQHPPPPGPVAPSRNLSMMASQPSSVQTNFSAPLSFMGNRAPPTGPSSIMGPFVPAFPQHVPNHPASSLPAGSSTGWSSGAPSPQPGLASMPRPSNISTANVISSVPFPPQPSTAPSFTSIPRPQVGLPSTGPVTSLAPPLQPRVPSSGSGSVPNFIPLKPPTMTPPIPGDFTFQPHRPQNPSFQTVSQPSSHFSAHNASSARSMVPPQAPSFQLPGQNMTTQPGSQVFLRPQVGDHMGQPPAHISAVPFPRNSAAMPENQLPGMPHLPMRPRNFNPAHQMPNLPGALPPRPGNHIQFQQSYPSYSARPEIPRPPNQQFSNNPAFASGISSPSPRGQQLYDPFAPTTNPTAGR